MKIKTTILIALLMALSVIARMSFPFIDWNQTEENSPNIIIARCMQSTPPIHATFIQDAPKSDSAIEIISVLKGTNNTSTPRLLTDRELLQGESYLVFGYYDGGNYQAYEEYRVLPLGVNFSTNAIAGKPLDEQIQILFKLRIDQLNRQITVEQEEKQRLEEGIKK